MTLTEAIGEAKSKPLSLALFIVIFGVVAQAGIGFYWGGVYSTNVDNNIEDIKDNRVGIAAVETQVIDHEYRIRALEAQINSVRDSMNNTERAVLNIERKLDIIDFEDYQPNPNIPR